MVGEYEAHIEKPVPSVVPLIGYPFFRGIFQNFVHISDRNCGVLNGRAAHLRQLTIHHRKLLHSVRARLRKIATGLFILFESL